MNNQQGKVNISLDELAKPDFKIENNPVQNNRRGRYRENPSYR